MPGGGSARFGAVTLPLLIDTGEKPTKQTQKLSPLSTHEIDLNRVTVIYKH